jgi:hypothetical protein
MSQTGDTAVVIPARNECDRIGATVTSARSLPGVDLVVVVDDGSRDGTAAAAAAAGARVVRHSTSRGKGAAMETGAEAVRLLEDATAPASGPDTDSATGTDPGTDPGTAADTGNDAGGAAGTSGAARHHLLFLDADLAHTAGNAAPLIEPIRAGTADMTVAVFTNRVKLGGRGFVVRLSGAGIHRATGFQPAQPLNGQRCLTRAAFAAALPLARGFGVETALTIDLLRRGMRITEVDVDLAHRATGSDWRGQLHRARQFTDVAAALAARRSLLPSGSPPGRG